MHPTVCGRCTPLHTGGAPHPAAFYQNYRDKPNKNRNFDTMSIKLAVLFVLSKSGLVQGFADFAQRTKCHRGHTGVFVDRLNRPKIASLQYIHSHNDTYER